MPLFIDQHKLGDYTKDELEKVLSDSHDEFGVLVHHVYFNENKDILYCICESPSRDSVVKHHQKFNVDCDSITEINQITTPIISRIEKLTAIGELASRITHDLRNPLSSIQATVELIRIRDKNLDSKTVADLERIEKAVADMSSQIEEILNHVRSSPSHMQVNTLSDILDSAKRRIKIPSGVKIDISCSEKIKINCDALKIEVVFINLLNNSIEAINGNGTIRVQAFDDKDSVTIKVQDSGVGISNEDLSRIFEPLFTTKQFGTGLGLVSCKRIVEEHGGSIDVKSADLETVFTVILPKNKQ